MLAAVAVAVLEAGCHQTHQQQARAHAVSRARFVSALSIAGLSALSRAMAMRVRRCGAGRVRCVALAHLADEVAWRRVYDTRSCASGELYRGKSRNGATGHSVRNRVPGTIG